MVENNNRKKSPKVFSLFGRRRSTDNLTVFVRSDRESETSRVNFKAEKQKNGQRTLAETRIDAVLSVKVDDDESVVHLGMKSILCSFFFQAFLD